MSTELRNGGCLTSFPAFPSAKPLPLRHTPQHWLSCLCHLLLLSQPGAPNSSLLPSTLLVCVYSTSNTVQLERCREAEKRRKRWCGSAISHYKSCDQASHKGALNNENYIWLRSTKAFPGITLKLHLMRLHGLKNGPQMWSQVFVRACRF